MKTVLRVARVEVPVVNVLGEFLEAFNGLIMKVKLMAINYSINWQSVRLPAVFQQKIILNEALISKALSCFQKFPSQLSSAQESFALRFIVTQLKLNVE